MSDAEYIALLKKEGREARALIALRNSEIAKWMRETFSARDERDEAVAEVRRLRSAIGDSAPPDSEDPK